MRRIVILALAAALCSAVVASAATLDVDGGVLQVFTFDGAELGTSMVVPGVTTAP